MANFFFENLLAFLVKKTNGDFEIKNGRFKPESKMLEFKGKLVTPKYGNYWLSDHYDAGIKKALESLKVK